jgi:urease accessory protein
MNLSINKLYLISCIAVGTVFPGSVYSHTGHDVTVSFMSGFIHPFSGIDHLLVIVLVGFWSAFILKKAWQGPSFFMSVMLIGVLAGVNGYSMGIFELGIALSVLALGVALLIKEKLSSLAMLLLIGVFGMFHGFAHSHLFFQEQAGIRLVAEDLAGILIATGILHWAGVVLARTLKDRMTLFSRCAGIASSLYGLVLLVQLSSTLINGGSI